MPVATLALAALVAHAPLLGPAGEGAPPDRSFAHRPYGPHPPAHAEHPSRRGEIGVVWLPLGTARLFTPGDRDAAPVDAAGLLALELRAQTGGGRLRLALEYASFGRVGEVGFKYDFNDGGALRPFLVIAAGGARLDGEDDLRFAVAGSVGLDLYLGQNAFLSAELRGRRFTEGDRSLDEATLGSLGQSTALLGAGFFF